MGLTQTKWDELNNDPSLPMYNRFSVTFAPGSTMKPITAEICIDSGNIDANEDYGAQMRW